MLRDSDTETLLAALHDHPEPFRWFFHDWPLANHFYRPVSTAFFQLDLHFYGQNAAGYGLTNALLVVGCILALFWFLRELTDDPFQTAAATVLFTSYLWSGHSLQLPGSQLAILCLIGGLWRHGLSPRRAFVPALTVVFVCANTDSFVSLRNAMINWLPGRTASAMTVFLLLSLACFARCIRTGHRPESSPSPTDPPATKSARIQPLASRAASLSLVVGALLFGALALGAYEQAVMLPFLGLVVLISFRMRRYSLPWWPALAYLALVVGYIGVRLAVVPTGPSHYQTQQFKHSISVVFDLLAFLIPGSYAAQLLLRGLDTGGFWFMSPDPWQYILTFTTNVAAALEVRRKAAMVFAGYALSVLAFAPMAWFKIFPHYYFLPMAFRALFAIAMLQVGWGCMISAWSLRERQAPPRPNPAPGSLPRL